MIFFGALVFLGGKGGGRGEIKLASRTAFEVPKTVDVPEE